jgi:transcriptional regulator with XRE-family HTH domain
MRTPVREPFADNFIRLLGLHRLRAKEAAVLLESDPATMSLWMSGKRKPLFETLVQIADFFQVTVDGLARTPFSEFLEKELANRERYELVEKQIRRSKRRLKVV